MGYTTRFEGELLFKHEPSVAQIRKLQSMFGEDCRNHPEWEGSSGLYYVDLDLNKEMTGIKWDGAEKSYYMERVVNVVIREMRKEWPEFGLKGQLAAQGEDFEDRWALAIEDDGFAHKREIVITGTRVECPHCGEKFVLADSTVNGNG